METLGEAEAAACIAALLRAAEERRPVALPPDFAQRCSPEQAQQLQDLHVRRTLARLGGTVIGIKLGGTSAAALTALGLNAPFVGPLFSARSQRSPARMARGDFIVCILETEIAVRIGRDIGGDGEQPTREALLEAIDLVFPVIEIADSRLENWAAAKPAAIVADLGYAGAWVRGEPCAQWRDIDLPALAVTLSRDGEVVRQGSGAVVLGDPLQALALAVAELGRRGRTLRTGEFVSTGTCTAPYPSAAGGRFVADFGPMGRVELELSA